MGACAWVCVRAWVRACAGVGAYARVCVTYQSGKSTQRPLRMVDLRKGNIFVLMPVLEQLHLSILQNFLQASGSKEEGGDGGCPRVAFHKIFLERKASWNPREESGPL